MTDKKQTEKLRSLPGVDLVLDALDAFVEERGIPRSVAVAGVRSAVERVRGRILAGESLAAGAVRDAVMDEARAAMDRAMRESLRRVVNATGVIVHTNLGRSLLAKEALKHMIAVASRYSNLEFDLDLGVRGSRYTHVENLLCELTGAEAALVVNNNAGAVFLSLETLARGKKVVVSRGELVEIGGSFRIPDVMARSGAILTEVGATNRTHLADYENAVDEETALLLKAHTSNFAIVGFTASVSLADMVDLGRRTGLPVMEDLGSGSFVDFSRFGLLKEPTVAESVAAGVDVVTFSGDKLLGGPQAGILVGKKEAIDRIKKNPIQRAVRIDKLTLAALESTLRLYRDPEKAMSAIPTLAFITTPVETVRNRARRLAARLKKAGNPKIRFAVRQAVSRVGGGALPLQEVPSFALAVTVEGLSASALDQALRQGEPPVVGRIEDDALLLDLRTVADDELGLITCALELVTSKNGSSHGNGKQTA